MSFAPLCRNEARRRLPVLLVATRAAHESAPKGALMEKEIVTRAECRAIGLDYSNTQFLRWEELGLLTPIKVAGRSSRVHYRVSEVRALIDGRSKIPAKAAA